ncbi:SsrA-binding protein SmpB [Haliangium ochraceum]|uniref:SsrA-binding protein n=1 Tax=Haliangium ochraceum (strain DSM 14365 / JCM 11303 / SMP-2) TaxID=502025 RepID=D0LUI2_HALO1|nr:SsrA-binding protein SmpB [Haliangium ochraceum]ACY19305.1 SsrA-binding protein [Haliangium ochraceum DSM 14365]
MAKKNRRQTTIPEGARVLARNRRALHDYEIHDVVEAGIVLVGSEVKSLRDSHAHLNDAHAEIQSDEAWLINAKIEEYPWANQFNHEPTRRRKLLLHKHEISRLGIKTQQRGFTLVPLAVYLKDGKIKVELALGSGKKEYEKRNVTRETEAQRDIDRALKRAR